MTRDAVVGLFVLARRIAAAAYRQELAVCRALGYPPVVCYDRAAAVMDNIYDLAAAPMPADVLTRFRIIRT